MKKSKRLFITGSVQTMFFEQFIKKNAERWNIKGFLRKLEDGRMEVFIEGDGDNVDEMVEVCKRGAQHTQIRNVEERLEKFQDFKDFKIFKI